MRERWGSTCWAELWLFSEFRGGCGQSFGWSHRNRKIACYKYLSEWLLGLANWAEYLTALDHDLLPRVSIGQILLLFFDNILLNFGIVLFLWSFRFSGGIRSIWVLLGPASFASWLGCLITHKSHSATAWDQSLTHLDWVGSQLARDAGEMTGQMRLNFLSILFIL